MKRKTEEPTPEKGRTALTHCLCTAEKITVVAHEEVVARLCPKCDQAPLENLLHAQGAAG